LFCLSSSPVGFAKEVNSLIELSQKDISLSKKLDTPLHRLLRHLVIAMLMVSAIEISSPRISYFSTKTMIVLLKSLISDSRLFSKISIRNLKMLPAKSACLLVLVLLIIFPQKYLKGSMMKDAIFGV